MRAGYVLRKHRRAIWDSSVMGAVAVVYKHGLHAVEFRKQQRVERTTKNLVACARGIGSSSCRRKSELRLHLISKCDFGHVLALGAAT